MTADRSARQAPGGAGRPIGLLCALPEELALLEAALEAREASRGLPIRAVRGVLDGRPVVLAETGVGKVGSASAATLLADRFRCRALVLSGVAGCLSPDLAVGDIVVASRVVDVDYGRATDQGFVAYQPGSLPLPGVEAAPGYDLPGWLASAVEVQLGRLRLRDRLGPGGLERVVRLAFGTVVSGDAFVASARVRRELQDRWGALAVEMEASGACGVAVRFDLPWLVVRALSDRAGEGAAVDFEAFVAAASETAATIVRGLLPTLDAPRSP